MARKHSEPEPTCSLCSGPMEPDRWRCARLSDPHCLGVPRSPGHGSIHGTLVGHAAALTDDRAAVAAAIDAVKALLEVLEQTDRHLEHTGRTINAAAQDAPDAPAPVGNEPVDDGGPQIGLHPSIHASGQANPANFPGQTIAPPPPV